jgi:hypothetical protein
MTNPESARIAPGWGTPVVLDMAHRFTRLCHRSGLIELHNRQLSDWAPDSGEAAEVEGSKRAELPFMVTEGFPVSDSGDISGCCVMLTKVNPFTGEELEPSSTSFGIYRPPSSWEETPDDTTSLQQQILETQIREQMTLGIGAVLTPSLVGLV